MENVLIILGASSRTAPIRLALQNHGVDSVPDILGLKQSELDALMYTMGSGQDTDTILLNRGDRNRLRAIQGYAVCHLAQTGNAMTLVQWESSLIIV